MIRSDAYASDFFHVPTEPDRVLPDMLVVFVALV